MMIDAVCFTGRWPFRKLGKPGIAELLEDHAKNGITGGVVSNLESIFYNDPMEGDEELAAKLPKGYKLAVTHNPLISYAVKEISRNPLNAAAVRLFPSYHGYNPGDDVVREFCRAAASAGLIVYIVSRMDDVRIDYIHRQTVPSIGDVITLARAVPECKFVLTGMRICDVCQEAEDIIQCKNLYVDTAYANVPTFPYDAVIEALPIERVLFATHYPMICLESNIIALKNSTIYGKTKDAVLYGNAEKLFGFKVNKKEKESLLCLTKTPNGTSD